MFHTRVLGTRSRNLDNLFTGEALTRYLLAENSRGSQMAVMEGVMGFYDGVAAFPSPRHPTIWPGSPAPRRCWS